MPGNGLAFAVRVGCQQHGIGGLTGFQDGVDVAFVAVDQLVGHGKAVLGIDRAVLAT